MMLINQNSYRHFSVPVVVAAYDGGVALEYGVKLGLELVQLVLVWGRGYRVKARLTISADNLALLALSIRLCTASTIAISAVFDFNVIRRKTDSGSGRQSLKTRICSLSRCCRLAARPHKATCHPADNVAWFCLLICDAIETMSQIIDFCLLLQCTRETNAGLYGCGDRATGINLARNAYENGSRNGCYGRMR